MITQIVAFAESKANEHACNASSPNHRCSGCRWYKWFRHLPPSLRCHPMACRTIPYYTVPYRTISHYTTPCKWFRHLHPPLPSVQLQELYLHSCFIPRGTLRQSNKGYGVQNYKGSKRFNISGRFLVSSDTEALYVVVSLKWVQNTAPMNT